MPNLNTHFDTGKEIEQDKETFSIKVICRVTAEKLTTIDMLPGRLKNFALEANEDEMEQLVTAVGILAWIARCCQPTISYRVSALQSKWKKPLVGDLKTCNTLIRYTLVTADDGIYFHHGLGWDDMCIG